MAQVAEAFLRLRVDPGQVRKDADKGLGQVDAKGAGAKAGKDFGTSFSSTSTERVRNARGQFVKASEDTGAEAGKKGGAAFSKSYGSGLSTIVSYAKYAAVSVAGVFVAKTISNGIKYVANLEQAKIGFTTMLGSAQKAGAFLSQLQAFAAKTPFNFPDLVRSSSQMIAFGFSAKQVIPDLTAIGDAAAGLGLGADGVERITLAIGQMQAKTRVQSDEILQLTESGVPALRILANQYHVTTKVMQDMITKGVVQSSKAIPLLLKGIEEGTKGAAGATTKFGGLMAAQSHTLTGLWSNFVDVSNQKLGQLITPAVPAIKSALTFLINNAGGIGDAMLGAARATGQFIGWVRQGTGPAVAFTSAIVGLTAALVVYTVTTKAIAIATTAWTKAQALLNLVLEANPVILIVTALVALGVALYVAWTRSATFRKIVIGAWQAILSFVKPIVEWFRVKVPEAFAVVVTWVKRYWPLLLVLLTGPIGLAAAAIIKFWGPISRFFQRTVGEITGSFTRLKNFITSSFDSWWAANGEALKRIWTAVWTAVTFIARLYWKILTTEIRVVVNVLRAVWEGGTRAISAVWGAVWPLMFQVFRIFAATITVAAKIAWGVLTVLFKVGLAVIEGAWRILWAILSGVVKVAWAAIVTLVKVGWDILVGTFSVFINLITGRWGAAWNAMRLMFRQVWNAIGDFFKVELGVLFNIAKTAWDAIARVIHTAITAVRNFIINDFIRPVITLFLTFASSMLHIAASAFGWIPGLGGKLRDAAKGFDAFKDSVNRSLDGIIKQVNVNLSTSGSGSITISGTGINQRTINTTTGTVRGPGGHTIAEGGHIRGPGTGTSDSIPAWVSNGEYVVKAASVAKYGVGMMDAINAGRYADGGAIEGAVLSRAGKGIGNAEALFGQSAAQAFALAAIAAAKKAAAAVPVAGGVSGVGLSGSSGYQAFQQVAARLGWSGRLFSDWVALEMQEAGFSLTATNPTSGAYGMAQFIQGAGEYYTYGGNPNTYIGQAIAMANYIIQRYGNPSNAEAHELAFHWYRKGGPVRGAGHRKFHQGGRIPEPVFGVGSSGSTYEFQAGEDVIPRGGSRAVVINLGGVVIREESDIALLAQKLGFVINAAGA